MRVYLSQMFLVSTLLFSTHVFGWGAIGHRTAGLIADAHLSVPARAAISQLLNKESLADVANWADSLKSGTTYAATHWYHFEKIPDHTTYLKNLKDMPPAQKELGGVIQAIIACQDILRSLTSTPAEKTDALKFLVHFIGDIHQPLHTGRPEDKGGVNIPVTWFGTPMSLHAVWDSGMIITGHKDVILAGMSLEQASLAYAQYLVKMALRNRVVYQSTPLETWMNESIILRDKSYDPLYEKDQTRYQSLNLAYVDARVLYSGLRLADTLNQIFAKSPPPAKDLFFKQQIEAIIGSISRLINLKP